MLRYFAGLDNRTKLLLPPALCLIGMLILGVAGWVTVERVKVSGPLDDEITAGQDLIADVLPPPMYLIETHLVVHETAGVGDPAQLDRFMTRYKALRAEYDARQAYWKKNLPAGEIKDLVTGPLDAAAREYFSVCETELIPALKAGDRDTARRVANVKLKEKYDAERAVVDQVVERTTKFTGDKSVEAAGTVRTNTRVMICCGLGLGILAAVIGFTVVTRVTRQMEDAIRRNQGFAAQVQSIDKSQAIIEFSTDGIILTANDNFLRLTGYTLDQLKGRHHKILVDPAEVAAPEYRKFWAKLGRGESQHLQCRRIGKGRREIWMQASYNAIADESGKPAKVVKYAVDITAAKAIEMKAKADAERQAVEAAELRRKVQAILGSVNALATGDFTHAIEDLGDDAVGQMAASLNQAVETIRTTLESVRDVAAQVADASGQLAAATDEISSGAQQQASSLEETASTLEEITATVKQNSDSAQQARQLASGSRDVAEKGGQVVGSAVEAMGEINQSSKKIADIITAIDEIAFQTNLLALNAAVEAARAGEQGRGFAVVAAEVRNLAQRSATAAKEIKGLIQDSVQKVTTGTDLVNRSGSTLTEIVTSVKRVTDIVAEIAAASREQATGIDQVNKAVTQMDSVTQRNASQTEELSATAQTLTTQAAQLRELVTRFKLDGGTPPAVVPAVKKVVRTAAPPKAPARMPVAAAANGHGAKNGKHGRGTNGTHELDRLGGRLGDAPDGFQDF